MVSSNGSLSSLTRSTTCRVALKHSPMRAAYLATGRTIFIRLYTELRKGDVPTCSFEKSPICCRTRSAVKSPTSHTIQQEWSFNCDSPAARNLFELLINKKLCGSGCIYAHVMSPRDPHAVFEHVTDAREQPAVWVDTLQIVTFSANKIRRKHLRPLEQSSSCSSSFHPHLQSTRG